MNPETNESTTPSTATRKKLYSFPVGVYFILVIHALKMVSVAFFRSLLPLFFTNKLYYSESESIEIYHSTVVVLNILPIIGGVLADNWFGDYYTIIAGFTLLTMGQFLIAFASIDVLNLPMGTLTFISLGIMAIGFAGESPCFYSFQGSQFILPEESKILTRFYYLIYYWINVVSLIASFMIPLLRADVQCFGEDTCYALPFLLAAVTQGLCIVIFIAGKTFYIIKKAEVNILIKVVKCIGYALKQRHKLRKVKIFLPHWLDYANDKYDEQLITDVKLILQVMIVYSPMPIYFSLYTQQFSSWVYMAARMDGNMGFRTLLPDQMHLLNPTIILIVIPIIKLVILPCLGKRNILTKLLDQILVGLVLVIIAYIALAIIQLNLEFEYPTLPGAGQAQLRIYNGLSCDVKLDSTEFKTLLKPLFVYENKNVKAPRTITYSIIVENTCPVVGGSSQFKFIINEYSIIGHFITLDKQNKIKVVPYEDTVEKHSTGLPLIRSLVTTDKEKSFNIEYKSRKKLIKDDTSRIELNKLKPAKYKIKIDEKEIGSALLKLGGVYTAIISYENPKNPTFNLITITSPNNIHMLWMLIPYLILTIGEIWIIVPSVEFSYTQAPKSMKSVMQAAYSFMPAIGNLLIILFERIVLLNSQAIKFFLWTVLMLVATIIFGILSRRYKYVEIKDDASIMSNTNTNTNVSLNTPNISANTSTNVGDSAKSNKIADKNKTTNKKKSKTK